VSINKGKGDVETPEGSILLDENSPWNRSSEGRFIIMSNYSTAGLTGKWEPPCDICPSAIPCHTKSARQRSQI